MIDSNIPMHWMKQVFTKNQLEKIEKKVDNLIEQEPSLFSSIHKREFFRDKILSEMHTDLPLPFKLTIQGGAIEHFKRITKNLFIAYPYSFHGEQFVMLENDVKKEGFQIIVDPFASRLVGRNMRVIIWKPNPINAKKR